MGEWLTIVTMCWNGWSSGLGPDYVKRLYNMVNRHLTIEHDFIVFADLENGEELQDQEFEVREIPDEVLEWPLNLPKFYMYSPDNGLEGRIIFMDLDSVIIGSIDEMLSYDGVFCGIKPFNPRRTHIGGGLLSFEVGYGKYLWEAVSSDPMKWAKATQGGKERLVYKELVRDQDRWQDLYPGQLVGYKRHCREKGNPPPNARFIAFHGKPRPHEVDEKWMRRNWR